MLESQQRITGAVNNRKEFLLSIVLPGMFHMKGRRAGSSSPQAEMYTTEKSARKKKCSYSYGSRGESEAVCSTRECYSLQMCLFICICFSQHLEILQIYKKVFVGNVNSDFLPL